MKYLKNKNVALWNGLQGLTKKHSARECFSKHLNLYLF